MRLLKRIVGEENAFVDDESLQAYSYDCSSLKIKPEIILLPNNVEQLRRIIVHANQHKRPISIRGNGSSNRGGCLSKDIIISMKRFNKVKLYPNDLIEVQAGVTISNLNKLLKKHELEFPLKPCNYSTTFGSFLARNGFTEESYKFGRVIDLLESINFIDGTGKYNTYSKKEDFEKILSWEGKTAIIISAKLKLIKREKERLITLDLIPFENSLGIIDKIETLKKRGDIISLEYLNSKCSELIDLKSKPHLMISYEGDKGSYKDLNKIKEIVRVRKNLHLILWQKNFRFIDDFWLKEKSFFEFMELCEQNNRPCFSSIGNGLFFCAYENEETWKKSPFIKVLKDLYTDFQGINGLGLLKKGLITKDKKTKLILLKEQMDYNDLLNKGVML